MSNYMSQLYTLNMIANYKLNAFARVSVIILCFFCLCVTVSAQNYYRVTSNSLTVRNRASSKARVLGKLQKGEEVIVESTKNGWATISYKNSKGYVIYKYLKKVEGSSKQANSSKASPTSEPSSSKRNNTQSNTSTNKKQANDSPQSTESTVSKLLYSKPKKSKATVYTEPNTKSKTLGKLGKKDKIVIYDLDGTWGFIEYKNKYGYVLKSDFEMTNETYVKSDKKQDNAKAKTKTSKSKAQKTSEPKKFTSALFVEASGSYTNFMGAPVSPVFGFGFGADVAYEFAKKNLATNRLEGYFAEASVGYARKGSGAYPLDYIMARVYPGGYRFSVSNKIQLMGKVGGYFGYSFSSIESYDDCNIDYGVVGAIGVSFDKFSLWGSYEHGFKQFTNLSMNNMSAYLTFSYRFYLK